MRKRVFVTAGYKTTFMGPGRKEFDPTHQVPFENYLQETAAGTLKQLPVVHLDEGIIGSFMSSRFLHQANLPGFLPFMTPELLYKPCTAVEGACATGSRAISMAIRSVLSDISQTVFVTGFEMQNVVKSVYGADILAGAGYYRGERKEGHAHFFPNLFGVRAKSYGETYGKERLRQAMGAWYASHILKARKNPKAQEYQNTTENLLEKGLTPPNPAQFLPDLNLYDCSKISDGAASLIVASEEGLKRCGLIPSQAIEIIGLGEAEGDITQPPPDPNELSTSKQAVQKALTSAHLALSDIDFYELHDCFTISGLLSLEAIGLCQKGEAPDFFLEKPPQMNLSGGLIGFGHPTGATGVRQVVDIYEQLLGLADNPAPLKNKVAMALNMGGNDKTVTCLILKSY